MYYILLIIIQPFYNSVQNLMYKYFIFSIALDISKPAFQQDETASCM